MYLACRSTGDNVIKYAFDCKQAVKRVAECFSLANDETFFLRESLANLPHHLISFSSFRKLSREFPNLSDRFAFLHPPLPRINSLRLRCFNVSLLSRARNINRKYLLSRINARCNIGFPLSLRLPA